jgi:hypothetical protein
MTDGPVRTRIVIATTMVRVFAGSVRQTAVSRQACNCSLRSTPHPEVPYESPPRHRNPAPHPVGPGRCAAGRHTRHWPNPVSPTTPSHWARAPHSADHLGDLGQEVLKGSKAYFDALNARGGINGRKIVLTSKDDAYDSKKTVENVEAFIAGGETFALFGTFGTPNNEALIPVALKAWHAGADALHRRAIHPQTRTGRRFQPACQLRRRGGKADPAPDDHRLQEDRHCVPEQQFWQGSADGCHGRSGATPAQAGGGHIGREQRQRCGGCRRQAARGPA